MKQVYAAIAALATAAGAHSAVIVEMNPTGNLPAGAELVTFAHGTWRGGMTLIGHTVGSLEPIRFGDAGEWIMVNRDPFTIDSIDNQLTQIGFAPVNSGLVMRTAQLDYEAGTFGTANLNISVVGGPAFSQSFQISGASTNTFRITTTEGTVFSNVFFTYDTPNDAVSRMSNFNVEVVPEPATMATLGIGALALLRRRRR